MKSIAFSLVLLCLAAGAFAIDASVGLGATGAYYMTDIKTSNPIVSTDILGTEIPISFLAFVDLTYLQLAAGLQIINGGHSTTTTTISGGTTTTQSDTSATLRYVSFAGYLKYPFRIGPVALFPLLGIEYDLTVDGTNAAGQSLTSTQKADFNEFWLKGGLGADFSITPRIFVRPELTVGYKLLSKPENDFVSVQKAGGNDASILDLTFDLSVLFGVRF